MPGFPAGCRGRSGVKLHSHLLMKTLDEASSAGMLHSASPAQGVESDAYAR
jgi:hypothetical protein